MTDVLYCPCGAEFQIPKCWTKVKCGKCGLVMYRWDPLTFTWTLQEKSA